MHTDLLALGLTAQEAELYALLVDSPPLTREALSLRWDRADRESSPALLAGLDQHGLITSLAGTPERVAAIAPDLGLADLAERRISELGQAKDRVTHEFGRRWVQIDHAVDPRDVIEIVVGRSAVSQRVRAIERAAQEVIGFDRPPYASLEMVNPLENTKLQEGCTYRSLYEGASLELPGKMAAIQEVCSLGEQARVLWGVPMKMVMADRRVAIVPLETDSIEVAAVVHPSSLLDSLYVLFELLWDQATPIGDPRSAAEQAPATSSDRDGHHQGSLLTMMAAGLTDKAIARQLGVTERTVQRWIRSTMTDNTAHTRFQLGLRLGRGGTISAP